MTHEQTQSSPLAQSVQLMREHLIKTDSNGYQCFLDGLHETRTVPDLMDLLLNVLSSRFQCDVIDHLPASQSEALSEDILDRKEAIETLHRCSYYGAKTFNAQFLNTYRYSFLNIHPESL